MGSVRCSLLAGAAALIGTAAMAADMPAIMPPAVQQVPVIEDVGSGWYLRGDIGFANPHIQQLFTPGDSTVLTLVPTGMGFDAAPVFGLGVGLKWNDWLRFDVTGQYRGSANFHGSDNISFSLGPRIGFDADNYAARKSEWLFLANAYVDLGTWWSVTPFIGAGVGAAQVNIMSFRDDGLANTLFGANAAGVAYFDDGSTWNFAWALHAGLAYKVTPCVTLELAYHYVNMGTGKTGLPHNFDFSPIVPAVGNAPFEFRNITSQDLTLGMRWMFDSTPAPPVAMPPLMRRG